MRNVGLDEAQAGIKIAVQESSPTPQLKGINCLALSFLYSPNSHIHTGLLGNSFD